MVKSGLEFFYFEIQQASSEIPIQPFWADFLHWAAVTLKGLAEF
jgi:hypothetical protein